MLDEFEIQVLCKGSTTFFDIVGCCLTDLCSVFDWLYCSYHFCVDYSTFPDCYLHLTSRQWRSCTLGLYFCLCLRVREREVLVCGGELESEFGLPVFV